MHVINIIVYYWIFINVKIYRGMNITVSYNIHEYIFLNMKLNF